MALSVSLDKDQFRYDSEQKPTALIADGTLVWIKLSSWQYYEAGNGENELNPPNRSLRNTPVVVRNLLDPTWTLGTGVTEVGSGIQRTTGTGNDGAYYDTPLNTSNCSIQAVIENINPAGISLQNGSSVTHDYFAANAIQHSIYLDGSGQGKILENGSSPAQNKWFKYAIGDMIMIELTLGIVRYYLIKPDGSMTILRTTRSKLSEAPKAEVLVYAPDSELSDVLVFDGDEASTSFENVGVLHNFQDWMNDFSVASTSDPIQMADNNIQFTFPNDKTRLRILNANLNMRTKDQRDDFLDFFNYHGNELEFIFVDKAHRDRQKQDTEFWAQFTSPFGDKARASCLSVHQAQITEAYRNDYVPLQVADSNILLGDGEELTGDGELLIGT